MLGKQPMRSEIDEFRVQLEHCDVTTANLREDNANLREKLKAIEAERDELAGVIEFLNTSRDEWELAGC